MSCWEAIPGLFVSVAAPQLLMSKGLTRQNVAGDKRTNCEMMESAIARSNISVCSFLFSGEHVLQVLFARILALSLHLWVTSAFRPTNGASGCYSQSLKVSLAWHKKQFQPF